MIAAFTTGLLALAGLGGTPQAREATSGEPAAKGLRLERVARFDDPVYLTAPERAGQIAYVVERDGRVKLLRGDRKLPGAFLDIRGRVSCCEGERGLITIAFAPDYNRSRRFYVFSTNNAGNIQVDEYRRSRNRPLRADRESRRKLLELPLRKFPTHDGGQLAFGPDGLLYISTGDGGSFERLSGNSQRKSSLFGKILRIDPTGGGRRRPYGVPRSNPFVGERGANEVLARGLRNPWRFSFDRRRIFIGDVGHDRRDEIDSESLRNLRGANFGWDVFEGSLRFRPGSVADHDRPVHEYSIEGDRCSVTGGYVVRDGRLGGGLRGRYVYADYCTGEIRSLRRGGGDDRRVDVRAQPGIVSFGADARDRLYTIVLDSGVVRRLAPRSR